MQEEEGAEEEEKTRLAGEKAGLEEKKRELETLRRRRIEVQQMKVTVEKDLEGEEQKRHTRVMLLIDAISKFKESIDVGWTGVGEAVERRYAAAYGSGEDAKCNFLPCLFAIMIDLSDIQFMYSKEEVEAFLEANQVTVEELLQYLIEAVFYYPAF